MKLDANMETDRLLRRFAQQRRDVSLAGDNAGDSESAMNSFGEKGAAPHLDADELAAYAENVMPAATRMRYAGHLSDCDTCRKQVTDLVLASGLAEKLDGQTRPREQVRSWRSWMTALFAPRVLRFAASVIVLFGVTAIAIMVFRGGTAKRFSTGQSPSGDVSTDKNIDDQRETSTRADSGEAANVQTPARRNGEDSAVAPAAASPTSGPDTYREGPIKSEKAGADKSPVDQPEPSVANENNLYGKTSSSEDTEAKLADRRQPAKTNSPAEKPKLKKDADASPSAGLISRDSEVSSETDAIASSQGASVAQSKAPASQTANPSDRGRARGNKESSPSGGARATDDEKSRADSSREEASQSVGGRQFVRRSGRWVDTAYRSQATTNVKRGSDQFRALMADEPGLRRIANQLAGEVVVVWKGRAYRIH